MVSAFARSLGVKPIFVVKDLGQRTAASTGRWRGRHDCRRHHPYPQAPAAIRFRPRLPAGPPAGGVPAWRTAPGIGAGSAGPGGARVAHSSYAEHLEAFAQATPTCTGRTTARKAPSSCCARSGAASWTAPWPTPTSSPSIVAIFPTWWWHSISASRNPWPGCCRTRPSSCDKALRRLAGGVARKGQLKRLMAHYYGQARVFDYVDMRDLRAPYPERVPALSADLPQAPRHMTCRRWCWPRRPTRNRTGIPHAISPTGVRGMMMLTRNTRRSAECRQSPGPGGEYRRRRPLSGPPGARLSDKSRAEDRIWFALAAYNVGLGHVRDARVLADRLGHDPDSWSDVAKVLPLAQQAALLQDPPHGYARGAEPVRYIRRIRNYADILRHKLQDQSTMVVSR